jgi:bifunctional enzyme CysN/CysC
MATTTRPAAGLSVNAVTAARDVYLEMDLLRLTTAGSVDDGKSTLIGRLLYDTKSIFEDQLQAIEESSRRRGEPLNLALLTDGLRAEREQNITIDVAYRYFATPKRKFIIADTPGHLQYTRNMVTGASTAELAIVLVDARKGVLTQSKRHGFIASLLGMQHLVVAVNKMDTVDYSQEVYEAISAEYRGFAEKLDLPDLVFIPVSALHGDNVVHHSRNMPWYQGATLLHHLESINVGGDRNLVDFRFPVQYVVRPHQDFRGLAGRIASGTIRPGEEIVALPSGLSSTVASIETFAGPVKEAAAGDSVVIAVADEIDISRGDMLVRPMNMPTVNRRFEAMLCWMSETPMDPSRRYLIQHTSRFATAIVSKIVYAMDLDTLHREPVNRFILNDIGRVEVTASMPLFFDQYQTNRVTGSFVLIDPGTNSTVAAGMIRGPVSTAEELLEPAGVETRTLAVGANIAWEPWNVPRQKREEKHGHKAAVLWFTGLPGSGKSTIARELERQLQQLGCQTMLLDGDQLRHGLCRDLGFSTSDRVENVRRAGEVARLFYEHGNIVLCAFISPFGEGRRRVRGLFPPGRFYGVHVQAVLDTCGGRDPKGLYARAARGEVDDFTGVSSLYEAPDAPELVLDTETSEVAELAGAALVRLYRDGLIARVA